MIKLYLVDETEEGQSFEFQKNDYYRWQVLRE